MEETHDTRKTLCALCGAHVATAVSLHRAGAHACLGCAGRLGRLLAQSPMELAGVWPVLAEVDEDDEPEPRVHDANGQVRELREVTAELKRELTPEARTQLAEAYGDMGMHREQVQECGVVLGSASDPALVERAMALLFSPHLASPTAVEQLRGRLFPA